MQYSSLNDPEGLFDTDRLERRGVTRAQREVAHLALDPAWIAAAAVGDDAFLQNLLQHPVMKLFPQLRGE